MRASKFTDPGKKDNAPDHPHPYTIKPHFSKNVVQGALRSLAELGYLGLLSKHAYTDLISDVARFTVHPNIWIREAAVEFIASGKKFLSPAYLRVQVLPKLAPYLKPGRTPDFSELDILESLQKPLSRSVFDHALMWASKTEKGDFWTSFRKGRDSVLGPSQIFEQASKNKEDDVWLKKLRNLGLSRGDEPKLLALREFIWRLSQMKMRDSTSQETANPGVINGIIPLRSLGITPQTILFDEEPLRNPVAAAQPEPGTPRTIEDALLDASMSIDDPVSKKRRAALNNHRSRMNSRDNMSPASVDSRRPFDDEGTVSPTTSKPGAGASRDTSVRTSVAQGKNSLSVMDDDRSVSDAPYSTRRALRHQSSAMHLMNRKDSAKSGPETGTTETNAFGQVERPLSQGLRVSSYPDTETALAYAKERLQGHHTYTGSDPNIIRMLDNMYIENYPRDLLEYGPLVTPVRRRKSSRQSVSTGFEEPWKPSGKLVGMLAEHVGPINRVVPSPDHQFFLTGGDDGCVKVWDTKRLERMVTHKARQTHRHAPGARVLAMCFVENTHSFVSCASDGSVHILKVNTMLIGMSYRYEKLKLLRKYDGLKDGEYVVWCEHYRQEANSVLVLLTNTSVILGIDLRTMTELYRLENPVHHGTPTCFCIDRKKNWLCLGTSHGVLDLWDLRFKTRLRGWGIPGKCSIYRVAPHPAKGRGRWVCVSGGTGQGEVTVWDLERCICREVYRVAGNKEGPKGYDPWEVDEDKPEGMLGRFATNIEPAATGNTDRGVRAMTVGIGSGEDIRDVRHAFVITGGSDKKLRYWDLVRVDNSVIFSGLQPEDVRPGYSTSHPTASMTLHTERPPNHKEKGGGVTNGPGTEVVEQPPKKPRQPRSTVISVQQQQLLKSHMDAITDVAWLESPYPMTVSVDRSGTILLLQ